MSVYLCIRNTIPSSRYKICGALSLPAPVTQDFIFMPALPVLHKSLFIFSIQSFFNEFFWLHQWRVFWPDFCDCARIAGKRYVQRPCIEKLDFRTYTSGDWGMQPCLFFCAFFQLFSIMKVYFHYTNCCMFSWPKKCGKFMRFLSKVDFFHKPSLSCY